MRKRIDVLRACFSIAITLAMVFSTTVIISDKASAEIVTGSEQSISEMPPYPPFTIYGTIHDKMSMPISDASISITNLRTDESLNAEFYENGAYEGILEDLPSGYEVNDEIEITVTADSQTITKIIVVKQMGFGERVDIHFGNSESGSGSVNVLTTSKIQNNPIETTTMSNEPVPLYSEPVETTKNPDPIIIDSIPTTSNSEPVAEITLVDMRAPPYFRLAFTGKENDLRFSLQNDGDERVIVIVDLYHVEPDGVTESHLATVHFGMLKPGMEKTKDVFDEGGGWIPTQTDRNWIRGEIYIKEKGHERTFVSEFKESFNVVPGWRPVLELGPTTISESTVWENLTVVINGDLVVNAPLDVVNTDVIGDDLTVTAPYTIHAGSAHDMAASEDGQFKVEVNPSGILYIYDKLWNNPDSKHYWFYMNGTLEVGRETPPDEPGTIENTHGSPDLSKQG